MQLNKNKNEQQKIFTRNNSKEEKIILNNKDNNIIRDSQISSCSQKLDNFNSSINHSNLNIKNTKNNISKDLDIRISKSMDFNNMENIKQDIINFYLIKKQKEREKNKANKNMNYSHLKKNSKINMEKEKNRFEKYDKEKISYEIYHQYQSIHFDKTIPFLERMDLYNLKKILKDYKVEELTKLQSPKTSNKNAINTFNRLIEDSNRRIINSYQKNESENVIEKKKIKRVSKSFDKKKWNEIYEKRFNSKLKERNEKLEKMREERENEKKREEDLIIENLNKKQILLNQRYGYKRSKSVTNFRKNSKSKDNNNYIIGNSKLIESLNKRLYYNEINKKDIDYKTFMDKAKELIKDNNNNNNFFISFGKQRKNNYIFNEDRIKYNAKKNAFRTNSSISKNKKVLNSNCIYNFRDNENINEKDNKNNNYIKLINNKNENSNFDKNKENMKNIENHKYHEINEKKSCHNSITNSKIEDFGELNLNYINNKERSNNAEKIINKFFES
jgi:hypothetical protein